MKIVHFDNRNTDWSPNPLELNEIFILKFLEDISPFRGATDTLFRISGNVCPGFQNQGRISFCGFLTCVVLRFTSGVTLANCTDVSMTAKPFDPYILADVSTSIGGGLAGSQTHNSSFS